MWEGKNYGDGPREGEQWQQAKEILSFKNIKWKVK